MQPRFGLDIIEGRCILLPSIFADSGFVRDIDNDDAGVGSFNRGHLPAALWNYDRVRVANIPDVPVASREDEKRVAL